MGAEYYLRKCILARIIGHSHTQGSFRHVEKISLNVAKCPYLGLNIAKFLRPRARFLLFGWQRSNGLSGAITVGVIPRQDHIPNTPLPARHVDTQISPIALTSQKLINARPGPRTQNLQGKTIALKLEQILFIGTELRLQRTRRSRL